MSGFVKADNVFVNQNAASRDDVLRFLADKAQEAGITENADAVYNAFLVREAMGETGMTDGFAVPHAKDAAIKDATVLVFKNNTPLEWPSFDEKPVDIAIALLVPDGEAGTTHIRLLSKTAVLLMRDEFKSLLRSSNDKEVIAQAINEGISEE